MREKEKKINRETFQFLQKKPAPPHLRQVKKQVWLSPENAERIANLARSKQISYSKALALLLDTEDAAKICSPVKIDWRERVSNAPDSLKCLEKGLIRDKHRSKKNAQAQRSAD